MRHSMLGGVLPLLAVGALACSPRADQMDTAMDTTATAPQDAAMVRVVHAVPGGPAVDVRAGQAEAWSGLNFKSVSPYRTVQEFRPTFTVVPAGQPTAAPLTENAEVVLDGRYYTVLAVPTDDGTGVELVALRDEPVPTDPAKARLRIVNVATGTTGLDVTAEGGTEPLFDNIAFKDDAAKELDPGVATLVVTLDDSETPALRLADVRLEAGKSLTIVLMRPTPGSTKLEALQMADEPTTIAGEVR